MKLTDRDQEQLAAALDVALGIVDVEEFGDPDYEALGMSARRCDMQDWSIGKNVRERSKEIILEMITKAGEPEERKES